MTMLITDTAHWIHAVPSQQAEVIPEILESKRGITIPLWTRSDVLLEDGC